ncbi:hypothetical protein IE991_11215 [Klebsiella pneumoniae]|uniref:Uncharacterized protein n=1 Tax=Klebsiella pneumoniae TaxID=573 RepID=A0A927D7L1_KLEPN|nr:hypothetical protein [Klebsiella pneumoniae]
MTILAVAVTELDNKATLLLYASPSAALSILRGNPSDSAGLGLKPQSTVITGYNGTLAQSQATWVLYYGRFCQSVMDYIARHIDLYLAKWVTRKYKRGHGSLVQAYE